MMHKFHFTVPQCENEDKWNSIFQINYLKLELHIDERGLFVQTVQNYIKQYVMTHLIMLIVTTIPTSTYTHLPACSQQCTVHWCTCVLWYFLSHTNPLYSHFTDLQTHLIAKVSNSPIMPLIPGFRVNLLGFYQYLLAKTACMIMLINSTQSHLKVAGLFFILICVTHFLKLPFHVPDLTQLPSLWSAVHSGDTCNKDWPVAVTNSLMSNCREK